MLRLYPLDERETEVFTVDADAAILGREGTVRADFFTRERFPYMSGRHAQLRRAPTGWYIKDTSRNGTALNGTPMQGREMMLKDGDFLTLYDYELRVSIL